MQLASDLEREAAFILGRDIFDELKEWYLYTLRGNWEYVFFVVRRSYVLALIFEEITGKRMDEQLFTKYYTDSAMPLLVAEFASRYRERGSFPRILLCDDLLIHGRNINFLAGDLERRLLAELNEYDPLEISLALMDAIQVHVYTCSSDKLLLRERYLVRTHSMRAERPAFYYRLSGNISSLILDSGFANATYVISESISEDDFTERKIENDLVKTSYQNTIQYTEVKYSIVSSTVKAAFAVRLIKNKREKRFCVVPFAFLPNLDMQETQVLHRHICGRMLKSGYFTVEDKEFLDFLLEQDGLRGYSELITMILSCTALQEFNRRYHIDILPEDIEKEIQKVSRNYPEHNDYDISDFLRRLIQHPFLYDLESIDDIIVHSLSAERYLFYVSQNLIPYSDDEIVDQLEKKIYQMGYEEERNAFLLLTDPSYTRQRQQARKVRGCVFLLRELLEKKESKSVTKSIAYFLQMLDAGAITLSSLTGSGIKVLGFAQFAKAGEQSLLLFPLKFMEYMPFLANMHQDCEQWARDFRKELSLYQKSGMSDLDDAVFDRILLFCQMLEEIGQSPEDWNGNYALRLELNFESEKKDTLSQVMHLISLQGSHVANYERYLEKR